MSIKDFQSLICQYFYDRKNIDIFMFGFIIKNMTSEEILKILKTAGRTTGFLLSIFLGNQLFSYKKMKRKALYPTLPDFSDKNGHIDLSNDKEKNRRKMCALLYQLKKQGFVAKNINNGKTFWEITANGKKHLEKLINKFNLPRKIYKKEKNNGFTIVIFDIPEKYRRKRDWLRHALITLEFELLQKSVWIGKNKIPKSFLNDLADLNIIDNIHIFSVAKTGTIKNVS